MAVDKNKVTAEATKLAQKGAFDKAIKQYEKILADDPKDVRVLLKVGELQQRKGENGAAAETFGRVADAYSEQGFFLKAVAVYKQMMKLAPEDARVNERLAGLYQQLGILSDAMAQLQLVAQAAERAGDSPKLLDVLRRMVELEPDNVGSAVKLGELYAKGGQSALALDQLRRAADILKRNNRTDEYLKVAERVAALAPEDLALTRELAQLHLAKGDTKRALAKLQVCFKADPHEVETLTLLAQAFKDLGQTAKTLSVYKELAHLYAERGRADDARATWRAVAELSPSDPEAAHALGLGRAGVAAGATRPAAAPATPASAPSAAPARAAGPGAEAIPKLLTETDVYVKYGLHEKALEHLQKVFAIDPDHLDAREKAMQLRAARNDAAGAAEEAVTVARVAHARGQDDRARAAVARLRELAPDHPALRSIDVDAVPASPDEDVVEVDGDEVELEVEAPVAGEPEDALALAAAEVHGDEVIEEPGVTIEVTAPRRAAPPAAPPPAAAPPPPPPPIALQPPRPAAAAPRAAAPPPVPRAAPAAPPPRPPPVVAAPPPPAEEEADLDDELEEAEFFVQQRLFDEARDALGRLLAFYPRHSKVVARLAELERKAAAPGAPPSPAPAAAARVSAAPAAAAVTPAVAPPPPPPEEPFDLARELAEELGATPVTADDTFQYSVEDVFSQFKKQVEETVEAEDADTHYDLGIAYKEMGLLDDAIHEFEVALAGKGRKKEIDGLTMIGVCRMEKGDVAGAIDAYRRALRSDRLTPEAARAIHYDLGAAYAAKNEPEHALFYLHKVLKADPKYRDARAVVARLGGGAGRPPPADAPPPVAEARAAAGAKKNIGYL